MIHRATTHIDSSHPHSHERLVALFLAILVAAMGYFSVQVQAQEAKYDTIPMIDAFKKESTVKRMERAAGSFASHRGDINAFADFRVAQVYFTRYIPAKMTQPDALQEVSESVQEMMSYLGRAQRGGAPAGTKVLEWVYIAMKPIAEGNYSPMARINATLVLGRLDMAQADLLNQKPPVPLPYSLPILIKLYEDENNVEGIRAAALHGIRRYVTYGFERLKDEERTKLTQLMTQLLDAPVPPNRSEKAHAFLQRYAVDILDYARTSASPDLAKKLVSISTDHKRPNMIATYSAARAGKMRELKGQVASPSDVLESWSARVWLALQDELKRLKSLERPRAASIQPSTPDSHLRITDKPTKPSSGRMGMGMGEFDDMEGPGSGMMAGGGMEADMGMGMGSEMGMDSDFGMESDMGMGMDMMGGEFGMGMPMAPVAIPQKPEVTASRKRLLHIIQQLHIGASGTPSLGIPKTPAGLLASVEAKDKVIVEKWLADMQLVVEALNDQNKSDETLFMEGLVEQIEILKEMAGPTALEIERAKAKELELAGIEVDAVVEVEAEVAGDPLAEAANIANPAGIDPAAIDAAAAVAAPAAPGSVPAAAPGNVAPAGPGNVAAPPEAAADIPSLDDLQ
ncbi:putative secreted protein [Rhodopirellula maiorica SM1]|uniref:Putative secreted protein n=1 Tax=Rhodopirellula maiorica SM1 TaxID=1265738 RepID=M5RE41_9BACT|nr:hypothetical protein [Rhodopirellula maiorica]EMI17331.1 putative secreted protein [Rhodopirellula maiorica SM1]